MAGTISQLRLLDWPTDRKTAEAAAAHPISMNQRGPAHQFPGCSTSAETWNDRVVQPAAWSRGPLLSSPDQIIKFFQAGRYTQALAMVVSWGGMGRRSKDIYGTRQPETILKIERTLRTCAESIEKSQSVADAWRALTGCGESQLGWSAVITSKTLHFLCRSLGFEQNPPVALDNLRMRDTVWPIFRDSIPFSQRPADWQGNSFEAYCRYMTAILTWANQRHWTTTQMEATLVAFADSVQRN